PVLVCPADITVDNAPAQCGSGVIALGTPNVWDNCQDATVSNDAPAFFPIGQTTVTWIATDATGNSSACIQTVTVNDVEAPIPAVDPLPNIIYECTAEVQAPTALDNCGGIVTATTIGSTVFTEQGTYSIVWNYSDGNGNMSSQVQTVIVDDVTAPVVRCQDIAIFLDANGNASIAISDILDEVSDNCTSEGDIQLSISQSTFDCSNVGDNTVTIIANDGNGNTATCTATVNITGLDIDNDGFTICDGDCEDLDDTIYPDAPELCDGLDNDCDGAIDEPSNVSTQYEWIEAIQLNDLNNVSGDNNGYANFTNLNTTLATGESYLMTLTPGYDNFSYTERWRIYIDYNQDGIFQHPQERVLQRIGTGVRTGFINVPNNVPAGPTRMRVVMAYGFNQQPCSDGFEGEIEDYTIIISACDNVTDGGTIGNNVELCGDDNDPEPISSLAPATGGSGTLEYSWWRSTSTSNPYQVGQWTEIPGANNESYDPGVVTQTTWFIRLARRNGCFDYPEFSNVVEVAYEASCNPYCEASGYSTFYEWIDEVGFEDIQNLSGDNNGYADFSYLSTDVEKGGTYTIYLTPGFGNATYPERWRVWIDFNQDGVYSNWEKVAQGISSGTLVRNITIPNWATEGTTGMRIAMRYGGWPNQCGDYFWGEVEDYTVNIVPAGVSAQGDQDTAKANNPKIDPWDQAEPEILLFPNPVVDYLKVRLVAPMDASAVQIRIMDVSGTQHFYQGTEVGKGQHEIGMDVSRLPSGSYLLNLLINDQVYTEKFIKVDPR
ncbi:MAG: GEVED domain-containing protein, partial [Bacteroidota bacterium]